MVIIMAIDLLYSTSEICVLFLYNTKDNNTSLLVLLENISMEMHVITK